MDLEKSLGRLNRAYLVVGLLVVCLLAARAFQRAGSPKEQGPETQTAYPAGVSIAVPTEQLEALETELATVTEERDALRSQVTEKEAQNAKLRESMESIIKDTK